MAAADSGAPGRRPSALGTGARITLHLGVLEQPYRAWERSGRGRKRGTILPVTTGDVAEILEGKYGLFSAFARTAEKDIGNAIETSVQSALESLLTGHAVDPWGEGLSKIEERFRDFISTGEAEHVGIPGTPTKAALKGVNHRLAHPYRKSNPRRPSFRDTGLLMGSFKSWVT